MRGLFLFGIILCLLFWGFRTPLIFVLGYVWASIFTPQLVAYSIITSIPISFIFGALAFFSFLAMKKPGHVKWRFQSFVVGLLVLWMTLTLVWAVAPEKAYVKWDWAIKSILFTIIIPHFVQSRKDFEAFIWTIVASVMAHCISFGAKVVLSGGGYGMPLGLVGGQSGLAEGSTLSMVAVSVIPMCIYLYFHQTLIPYARLTKVLLGFFVIFLLLTAIGTYARTGVICLAVLSMSFVYFSQRKLLGVIFILILAAIAYQFTDENWLERMSSINNSNEASAMGRVAVWKWVIEYIAQNPWGGSFEMYVINNYALPLEDGSVLYVKAKAFHSIYFEMLGEGGVPGLLLYLALIMFTLSAFAKYKKLSSFTSDIWLSDAGRYLLVSSLIFLAGGAFIGVAFQSYFYYLSALSAAYLNLIFLNGKNR